MTVIFINTDILSLFKKFTGKAFDYIYTHKLIAKFISFCLVGIFAIVISIVQLGITLGFDVDYSGKIIATVSDASVFNNAKSIAVKNIQSTGADKAIQEPKFLLKLTVADKLCDSSALADAIIKNTSNVASGSALTVNGEKVICTEADGLSELLEARLKEYYVKGAQNTSSFADEVSIEKGYYLKQDIGSLTEAEKIINELNVITVSTSVSEKSIPYTVKKVKSDTYENGYRKVEKQGENGLKRTTVVQETVNGVINGDAEISEEIITQPVEQIEIIGTYIKKISATERAAAASNGFILPLNAGTFTVSAYFGDGRNHQAIDLATDKGSAIFAVSDGVVTSAGYDGQYGYNVIIDHGNGIKTRYAHASALCVSKGDKVTQGEMIAAVGSTGYSTGNHLHFEVIVNGKRVNPAPYIGL